MIQQYLNEGNVKEAEYPSLYSKLINAQEKIGWLQIMRGRILKQFIINHNMYAHLNKHKMDGKQWNSKVIQYIWKYMTSLWKNRNKFVHGDQKDSDWHQTNLTNQVKSLHCQKQNIDPSNIFALEIPINQILMYNNSCMKKWIE